MSTKQIPTARQIMDEFGEEGSYRLGAKDVSYVRDLMKQRSAAMEEILNKAFLDKRNKLHASEQREYDDHQAALKALAELDDLNKTDYSREIDGASPITPGTSSMSSRQAYAEGAPLTRGQTLEGYVRSRGLATGTPGTLFHDGYDEPQTDLSLRKALRGIVSGDWKDADAERRAMGEGTTTGGGYLVPTLLSAQLIDLARNRTRVLQAGARIVPMENRKVVAAKWTGDQSAAWHSEHGVIAPSDASLGSVELNAQTMTSLVVVSRELIEDADNVEEELRNAFAAQFALTMDKVALYGTGTAPEPRGVKNVATVAKTPLATDGATPADYDFLADAIGRLADANEAATGIIYSPRTERVLGKLKDAQKQPLAMPAYVADVRRYSTNQVPNDLTVGAGTTCSDVFTADWSQLLIGMRTNLQLQVLSERYADTGEVGFLAWMRGDVAVARSAAFDVTTGVLG